MCRRCSDASCGAQHNGVIARLPALLRANSLFLVLALLPLAFAAPVDQSAVHGYEAEGEEKADLSMWANLGTAVALVLLGGAFAGLTIALMGQDEIYLQVIATSGEGSERKNAKKVLRLLKKGKHWVLVTLLLSNVITNETLPIVLDRSLGGGWPAVLSSTVLIVIFGEIAPQSVCVRYGLPIGAWCSPFVLALMWILSPVAWPTAKLLDWLLGEDHGTTYKKAGLKTLVTLHKTLGKSEGERLNEDEVTIISAVLDLKDKPVGSIMTPIADVFTLSADTVLDEEMMNTILSAGYSRIPVHTPNNTENFIGMLLVKTLITYDPEDALRVRDFSLATLPETRPDTSCLDIVNYFQEGKSHMVLVSDFPGTDHGALGVVTLEDVIEELIGEEIIDESDVFIDVHKAIRRIAPAPFRRVLKGEIVEESTPLLGNHASRQESRGRPAGYGAVDSARKSSQPELPSSPKATFLIRRRSSGAQSADGGPAVVPIRSTTPDIMEHLKHLGPSNVASRPKQTRINTVKIKPGVGTIPEDTAVRDTSAEAASASRHHSLPTPAAAQGGVGERLVSAGRNASDGVQALQHALGARSASDTKPPKLPQVVSPPEPVTNGAPAIATDNTNTQGTQQAASVSPEPQSDKILPPSDKIDERLSSPDLGKVVVDESVLATSRGRTPSPAGSTVGSLQSISPPPSQKQHRQARSGSITEQIIESGGIKKVVLETTSSSDSEHGKGDSRENRQKSQTNGDEHREAGQERSGQKKKKRKKRAGKKKGGANAATENNQDKTVVASQS